MREFTNRHPLLTYGVGFFAMLTLLPILTRGMPGGFWAMLIVIPFLPGAFRALWQDIKHIFRWTRARTARAKVSDDALKAFLAEHEDERH